MAPKLYVKIHFTRVHPQQWQQHQAQTQQWRRQHISKTVHKCAWCGGRPSKGNAHSDTCPVLFQVTMVNAIIQAELRGPDQASTEPIPVVLFHCQFCSHACKRGLRKHMKDCLSAWWHQAGSHVEALCSGRASGLAKPHCQFCNQPINVELSTPAVATSPRSRMITGGNRIARCTSGSLSLRSTSGPPHTVAALEAAVEVDHTACPLSSAVVPLPGADRGMPCSQDARGLLKNCRRFGCPGSVALACWPAF